MFNKAPPEITWHLDTDQGPGIVLTAESVLPLFIVADGARCRAGRCRGDDAAEIAGH